MDYLPLMVRVTATRLAVFEEGESEGDVTACVWLDLDAVPAAHELFAQAVDDHRVMQATAEYLVPLADETDPGTLDHWGHPAIRVLLDCGAESFGGVTQVIGFALCASCGGDVLPVLTSRKTFAIGSASMAVARSIETATTEIFAVECDPLEFAWAELTAWRDHHRQAVRAGEQLRLQ